MHLVHVSARVDVGERGSSTLCVDPVRIDVHVCAPVEDLFDTTADLLDLEETRAPFATLEIIWGL